MSEHDSLSWITLNAYVDGELEPDEAAKVAAVLARDRAAAVKVATLTRLRAAVKASPPPKGIPAFELPRAGARPMRWLPMAAAILVALAIGVAAAGLQRSYSKRPPLADAVAAHELWLAQPSSDQAQRLGVELTGADVDALPDLALASLRLVHLSLDPSGRRGGGVLAGYVGPNGCRVGLWIAPVDETLPTHPAVHDRDGLAVRAWRGDHASYALIGRGIDPGRLDAIAALVARITRDERGIPREQVAALTEARNVRPACVA